MARVFTYIVHRDGVLDDSAAELAAAGRKIDPGAFPIAIVTGCGAELDAVCSALTNSYSEVWKISNDAFAHPNPELIRQALTRVLPTGCVVLIPHNHFGIDLAPGLSITLNAAYAPDIQAIDGLEGTALRLVRQEFGGQVSTHVRCVVPTGAVLTIRPGAFKPTEGQTVTGQVIDKSAEVGSLTARRRYLQTMVAEAGDVDITKHAVLVSVGRGIQGKENILIAQELADELGGAVSCSRPVVDAKWLEKSRQVGSSGKTVKPKVYLACGISGSFQHLAGLKGNPFIVAINKNPKAPIFQVADVGIVDDILEFLPEMTNKVRELHTVSRK